MLRCGLAIAGFDPSAGAGVLLDVVVFRSLGVYGFGVVSSIFVESGAEYRYALPVPSKVVEDQIRVLVESYPIHVVKIGALYSGENIEAVARILSEMLGDVPIVLDPLIRASTGGPLLDPSAVEVLKRRLLPIATVVTPNVREAEVLSGIRIQSLDDAKRAAKIIADTYGVKAVLVKGGHLPGEEVFDVLYVNGEIREFRSSRLGVDVHGTGCVLSTAIAAYLAKGFSIVEAVERGREVVRYAMEYSFAIGRGSRLPNPLSVLEIDAERYRAIKDVEDALRELLRYSHTVAEFVPEVGMNIARALPPPYARGIDDVAAIEGRIVRVGDTVKPVGCIRMGASRHMARAVLAAQKLDPRIRAVANLRYDPRLVEAAKELGLEVVYIDRRSEPEDVKAVEGASIPWIVGKAFEEAKRIPDIVYDTGDVGKEPMVRVFGSSARDVVEKMIRIVERARCVGGSASEEKRHPVTGL